MLLAAEEEVQPALTDHWQDVSAAFHDSEAHHLYVAPEAITAELDARAQHPPLLDRPGPAVPVPRPGRRGRRPRHP